MSRANGSDYEAPDLAELVEWADIIDGARYANAQEAVELKAPAMQLTLVIEGAKGSEIIHKIIGWMRHCKLGEIVQQPEIQQLYAPLYERHLRSIDIIQKRAADGATAWCFSIWSGTIWKATTSSSRTIFSRIPLTRCR